MKRYNYDIKSRTYVERKHGAVCAYSDVAELAKRVLPAFDDYYITLPDDDNPDIEGKALKAELEQIIKENENDKSPT